MHAALALLISSIFCTILTEATAMDSPIHRNVTDYLPIEELYTHCSAPGPCGKKMTCEGTTVLVKGFVDYSNVFHKKRFPHLPYEKFMIVSKTGINLEIYTISKNNETIYEKIMKNRDSGSMAHIEGMVEGIDMPMMGECTHEEYGSSSPRKRTCFFINIPSG